MKVPGDETEARRQQLLPPIATPASAEDAPERAFFASNHLNARFVAWRVPVSVHHYEHVEAQAAAPRYWKDQVGARLLSAASSLVVCVMHLACCG